MQSRNDGGRLSCHLPVGEPQHAETPALKMGIPDAVSLEGGAISMVPEAVGLDDQGTVAPEEVDLVGPNARVYFRTWKAVA
jgi:hypothetical protein